MARTFSVVGEAKWFADWEGSGLLVDSGISHEIEAIFVSVGCL